METAPPILQRMAVLADAARARVLRLLERRELTVAELCAVLQLPQSTVSRHLKVLADDGWVSSRKEGTSRLYRMALDDSDPAAGRLWGIIREQTDAQARAREDDARLSQVLEERRTRSQEFFSSTAGQWDRVRRELFGERFDLFALAGLLDESWVVGDLGCGTGEVAQAVAPFVKRVVGVDFSPAMLHAARERLEGFRNVEMREGELEALPLENGELEAAVTVLVLHHLPHPDHAIEEMARVIGPGGRVLIVEMSPHEREEYRQRMGHVWLGFEQERMTRWLEQAGFKRVRCRELPVDREAKGPGLFAATGVRG